MDIARLRSSRGNPQAQRDPVPEVCHVVHLWRTPRYLQITGAWRSQRQGIEGQVGGHQDKTSARGLDEEEAQDAVSRLPDQLKDEIADRFPLLVNECLDGEELAGPRVG